MGLENLRDLVQQEGHEDGDGVSGDERDDSGDERPRKKRKAQTT